MKQLIYFILIIGSSHFITSCSKSNTVEKVEKLDGNTILKNYIKYHGGILFNSSKITFEAKETNYEMINYDHKVKYTMTKTFKDGLHVVTYDRGYLQYFRNDTLRKENSYNNIVVSARIEDFLYKLSIPFNLDFNGTKAQRLKDVNIRLKKYYSVLITFTKIEGVPENKFILYIDQENFQMEYLALDYNLLGNNLSFRRFINPRIIDGILFQDFIPFSSKNNSKLEDLYQEYNDASLQDGKPVELTKIKVTPITKDPFIN